MAVYNRSKEALLQASELVRTETLESANSAERVGQLFYDITEHILDVTVTPEYPAGTNSVLIADIVVDGQNNLIYAPKGGGGGPTNNGYQKVYFATVLKGVTVQAPTSEDYDPSADGGTGAFTRSTPQWHSTDDLPAEGECVYAIWVYFNANNLIITIDGPVVINSGNSGSNGEDGEEIEWIYIRKPEELTPIQMTLMLNFLETCKGSAAAKDGKTFNDPDAVPQGDWTDNAQGITEQIQYEYAAFRRSKNNSNGERTWGDDYFHGPLLWSAYGKQGMDGDGVEYIFYADRDGSPSWGSGDYPPNWNDNTQGNWKDPNDHSKGRWTFLDNEFIAEGSRWTDNPINIETLQKGAKQWSCMRKKQDGVWQAYQAPTLWSYYAKDGVANGYTTDLVNENMPVGTDDEGTATNYTNHGIVQAFHNEDALQYTSTVGAGGYPAEGYFTYIIGNITRSDDPEHTVLNIIVTPNLDDGAQFDVSISSISNFANVNAYIPITVKLPNGTDLYLECTLYGIATGEAGQAIDIWTNADVIRDNDTGSGTAPAQLQIGVKIGRGENVHTYYSGGVPSAESMNFHFGYRYDDGQMLALTPGTLTLEPNHSTLTIEMRQGNSFAEGHFVDSEDIPYVKNGATITNILPYYRAVESENKKPGTNGQPDISLSDSQTVEGTTFGSSYPFLYRRDYYTFSDDTSYFGVTVFDRRYFEPAEATYTISTINDNAIIDDQTTGELALETATLNPITVYLGNDDVTTNCHYRITASNLPNGLKIQTKNGNTKADIGLNVSTTINTFLIAPTSLSISILSAGNYYYDVLVEEASKTKRFKLYIDENVSPDGSFYKLHIEHDTLNYDASNNLISSGNPTVTAYRYPLGGGSELLTLNVTTDVPLVASDTMYLVVGSVLNNARTSSSGTSITFSAGAISYSSTGYELSLYRGNLCVDGPEKIDCTKLAVESEEAAYVIATINDNAAIDDLTVSSSALRIATLNPIAVYKGNDNITSGCIFDIADKNLKTTEIDVESTTDSSYPSSKYKVYHIVLKDNTLTKLTPGSYSYDVVISDSSYNEIGRKRFKLYIDKDISTDGSFYKLVIENDTIEYDSSGTVISLDAPTAKVYKVPINGDPVQQSATVVKTKPTTPSENLYLLVDNTLYNAATTSQQDIVFNTANIPYKADKYELTLYKGNKYQDGPEYMDCTKEASAGVDGYSLVTNPAYIIIDELIASSGTTDPSTGVVTYYAQTLTVNELKALYAIIKVLKGRVPQVIGVGLNTFNTTIGTAEVVDASTGGTVSSSTTALKVYLTSVPQKTASSSPTGWNQSEGKITFTVTLGGSSFYSVEIPVYINRLGTRFQTIAGDVETTMMSKTAYTDLEGNVYKWGNLGTYLRSSEENVSTLSDSVDDIEIDVSEIKLKADSISLNVTNGWLNYIANPKAVDATIRPDACTSYSKVTDDTMGKVYEISYSSGGDWQLKNTLIDSWNDLTGKTVTWFCIVRAMESSGQLFFGSGFESSNNGKLNEAVAIKVTNGKLLSSTHLTNPTGYTYYDVGSLKLGSILLGSGWYMCWTSIKLSSTRTIRPGVELPGFNCMIGKWRIFYAGIVKGSGVPPIQMILEGDGLRKAGIDITQGRVDVLADNFTVKNNVGELTLGLDSDGNFEVSGTIKAYNLYRNLCIITGWYSTYSSSSSIFYSTNWYYCSYSTDETERYGYEVGKYYENPLTYDGMVQCTYAADIISLRNNASYDWPSGGIICIPRPLDFPGKTIEIRHNATNGNNAAVLKACDGSSAFADFLYSAVGGTESIRAYYPVVSLTVLAYDTMSLYSYYFSGDEKYYWRIVGLIHGGGLTADVNNIHYEDGLAKRTL